MRWFGATSFWGHVRHFIASAIASENVDSRDWMAPDEPAELLGRIAELLGGDPRAPSLLEALGGRDLYVDFVADTGDDVSVSRAVATLVFAPYELPDPDRPGEVLSAPRGDILLFGGDTAYPVATAKELTNRVIAPWNQVLLGLPDDGRRRVLMGVPGNHDWYDGLDGFGRMFRRRTARPGHRDQDGEQPSLVGIGEAPLEHPAKWAREFVRAGTVGKPGALVLAGYTPVQNASYFALALAPGLELLAVDRQLTSTDYRQARFLGDRYRAHPRSATLALLPDPVYLFGVPSRTGRRMVESLGLDLQGRETFVLTGDLHHYERLEHGRLLQVIAGGGGAFLHPARFAGPGLVPRVAWPNRAQCRPLLRQIPWKLALGSSGFLPHLGLLTLFGLGVLLSGWLETHTGLVVSASLLTTLSLVVTYALIGGVIQNRAVLPFAAGAALLTALLPTGGSLAARLALERLGWSAPAAVVGLGALAVTVFGGAFLFGAYLALLTRLGLENLQAFAVLDHPGFKHFVRLRVRADGRGIDGWCIGATDPIAECGQPVLVDQFTWRPSP